MKPAQHCCVTSCEGWELYRNRNRWCNVENCITETSTFLCLHGSKQYIEFSTYIKKNVLIYLDCWCSISIFLHDFPWFSAKQKKGKKEKNTQKWQTHNIHNPTNTTVPNAMLQHYTPNSAANPWDKRDPSSASASSSSWVSKEWTEEASWSSLSWQGQGKPTAGWSTMGCTH